MNEKEIAAVIAETLNKEPNIVQASDPVHGGERNPFAVTTVITNDSGVFRVEVKQLTRGVSSKTKSK